MQIKKQHYCFWAFLLILEFFFCLSIKAQDTLIYPTDSSFIKIEPYSRVYSDGTATLDFDQVKKLPDSLFVKTKSGLLSFGTTTANVWVKLSVKNQTTEALFLNFWSFGVKYIDVYTQSENGELVMRQTGAKRPFMSRDLKRGNIAINIGKSPSVVYIRLKTNLALTAHVTISALKPFSDICYKRDTFNGVCMGILMAMALYNLFLFFSVKERLYLYYFAYILMSIWLVSELNSLWRFFINWGQGLGIKELICFTGVIFSMRFLNTRDTMPWGHKVLMGFIVSLCLSFIFDMLDLQPFANQFYQTTTLVFIPILPFLGIIAYRQGNKSALYYTIAWSVLIISGIVHILVAAGIVPFTFWTNNSIAIGTCIETILLAFALAYRLKTYRDASESAQKLAIQSLEENERLVKEQNRVLEEKVQERTTTLQASLETLKSTQVQLIQSEKLASLGELTAGIAHEIQNPLNFVNNFAELSVDLAKELNEELEKDSIDKVFVKELMGDLTSNQEKINHHGKRAAAIVTGMLQHARTSSGKKEPTDLNALADEYLRLSYHGLRAKDSSFNAKMETDFDPAVGMVDVVPQDIGRVFLNIINNAFYAVSERKKLEPEGFEPTVSVSSRLVIPPWGGPRGAEFRIKDNGTGIPDDVKARIFQPFFTTKPTGQGTGLGLSLAYDIVTKGHGGTLEVENAEGVGTEFIVKLP